MEKGEKAEHWVFQLSLSLSLRAMSTSYETKGRVVLAYSGGLGKFRPKFVRPQ